MTKKRQNDEFEIAEVNRRLKLLLLVDKINSVTEACKQTGYSRTQYYLFKKRYDEMGLNGLSFQYHTQTEQSNSVSFNNRDFVRQTCILNPSKGAAQISQLLKQSGISLGTASTHKLLSEFALSTRKSRWIFLENYLIQENVVLTEEQKRFIEEMNPCHSEKGNIGSGPGDILVQDIQVLSISTGIKFYIHFVVDTFGNRAFGRIYDDMTPVTAIHLLRNYVIPYYKDRSLHIQKICTHNGRTFSGNKHHDYSIIVQHEKIYHEVRPKGKTHGFSRRFQFILETEFVAEIKSNPKKIIKLDVLQEKFSEWLTYYNEKRGHFGFPNYGKIPCEFHL